MFDFPEPASSIFETFNFVKILEEQSEGFQRNSNLPFYVRLLLKKKNEVYLDYFKTRSRSHLITYYKLNQIYQEETKDLDEDGVIGNPNSLYQMLEGLKKELIMSECWYRITKMKVFWDIYVGLFNVKVVLHGIKDIKKLEYDVLKLVN